MRYKIYALGFSNLFLLISYFHLAPFMYFAFRVCNFGKTDNNACRQEMRIENFKECSEGKCPRKQGVGRKATPSMKRKRILSIQRLKNIGG